MDIEIGYREVGKMARGGNSEELDVRTKTILHAYFTLYILYRLYILMKSLGKWNTTTCKAAIIVYCYSYNEYSCLVCPSPKLYH